MLTIFTCPKPFTEGHIKTIQINAIRSWTRLKPTPEIMLMGDDEGVSEIANELNVTHMPNVQYNERGIPMQDSVFNVAQENASNKLLCYINADIILMQDFIQNIMKVAELEEQFLIVSRRWDVDITHLIDFDSANLNKELKSIIKNTGKLHSPAGIDTHVSSSKVFTRMRILPFVLGRGGSDNWLIWRARSLNIPVIDITPQTTIIHQNHDYSHISPGAMSWKGSSDHPNNPDYLLNMRLTGRWLHKYQINHASHKLTTEGLKYRYIHPLLEPLLVTASLFKDAGISELLNMVPSLKRAIKQIIR